MSSQKPKVDSHVFIAFSNLIKEFYSRKSAHLAELKLKPSQALLLHFLLDYEGLNQQELANFFSLRPSTMSELITGLENSGQISRQVNPKNKRMVFITLTPLGRKYAKKVFKLFEEFCLELLAGFSEAEIDTLQDFLHRITDSKVDASRIPDF